MKKSLFTLPIVVAILAIVSVSCGGDDTWKTYETWRNNNQQWLQSLRSILDEDGKEFYQRLSPEWNKQAYIYIHYFNDRRETEGNLQPLYTSTCNVKYIGRLYNDVAFDSSYNNVDSIFTTRPSDVIAGWGIALQNMRVGDSVRVAIPYEMAYGTDGSGSIPPYSALQFDIKLVDIPAYEIKR